MSQLSIGVGDGAAQQRFIEANKEFLLEHPALHRLLERVSRREHYGASGWYSEVPF
jgi:hypothetical protein